MWASIVLVATKIMMPLYSTGGEKGQAFTVEDASKLGFRTTFEQNSWCTPVTRAETNVCGEQAGSYCWGLRFQVARSGHRVIEIETESVSGQ